VLTHGAQTPNRPCRLIPARPSGHITRRFRRCQSFVHGLAHFKFVMDAVVRWAHCGCAACFCSCLLRLYCGWLSVHSVADQCHIPTTGSTSCSTSTLVPASTTVVPAPERPLVPQFYYYHSTSTGSSSRGDSRGHLVERRSTSTTTSVLLVLPVAALPGST
jgi:hypothetical protein